jgi:glycine C-acetyltransferase
MVCAAGVEAIRLVEAGDDLRARLFDNTAYWRVSLETAGFKTLPGEHPIVPVMLGDARLAQAMAARLGDLGIYVAGFFFPVVPKGQARIRTQMNAALTREDLDRAAEAFQQAGRETGAI